MGRKRKPSSKDSANMQHNIGHDLRLLTLPKLPEERTFGGAPGTGQDVTIILIPNGGCKDQKLGVIHMHSNILRVHSKYFDTCLSDRWTTSSSSQSPLQFSLEVQADIKFYFHCFSSMYLPFPQNRSFGGIKYGLELVKVASQIDFQELLDHILLYLSTIFWSDEDEIRIREYSSSPDFPSKHAEELVARLGLDESEEDHQKRLCHLIRQCICFALKNGSWEFRVFFEELLQREYRRMPNFPRTVAMIVATEAKDIFANIESEWSKNSPISPISKDVQENLEAMSWVLETLLSTQVAEELVQYIVHLSAIPQFIDKILHDEDISHAWKLSELVVRMYREVIDGHLLLRIPERLALLENWYEVGAWCTKHQDEFPEVTEKLFLTLPLKQQIVLINKLKEESFYYISPNHLISMLSKKSWPATELEPEATQESNL